MLDALPLITLLVGAAALALQLCAVALLLAQLCELVETRPRSVQRWGMRLVLASGMLLLLGLPTARLLAVAGLSQLAQAALLRHPRWPASPPLLLLAAALPAVALHLLLLAHHRHSLEAHAAHAARPLLPGGRQPWDAPPAPPPAMTAAQTAALCALLWAAPLLNLTAACAQSWGLPAARTPQRRN